MTRLSTAFSTAISPPQLQTHEQAAVASGTPWNDDSIDPGNQLPTTTGRHGIGVSTPIAAAVALATLGLAGLRHSPNGGTFTPGTVSITVAVTITPSITSFPGNGSAMKLPGAAPMLHVSRQPVVNNSDTPRNPKQSVLI